ncbi:hypothetical protein HPTD01_507 [Halomonas sp. TD01]|nr:hypothetical protein GME_15205 [Halomonas sp. TD01]CAH1042029.1 hypothetical protein HPTD01_507 [Halomonas sp. TD01]
MPLINKIRIWSFVICFLSGGALVFGPNDFLEGALWGILANTSRISAVFAVVTTFIVLIDSAGNGLNELQRKKGEKNKKKRR